MRLVMQVERVGSRYRGSLTRPEDEVSVGFEGVLELVAALDRLDGDEVHGPAASEQEEKR